MAEKNNEAPPLVRIIPVPGRYIVGVPDVAQDVSPEKAQELLAYTPPAFVAEKKVVKPVTKPVTNKE